MSQTLRVGYVPLADAALLIVAQRKGFAEARGLRLDLVRETSWANIRDKLALGYFDAAHMLAPAAIACSLGLAQVRAPLRAVAGLGLNGNAITVSKALFEALSAAADGDLADPAVSARALRAVVTARKLQKAALLTFAHVFPYSSHHYQLRIWMAAGGVDPDNDVNLLVLPPPFMARSLELGQIDGFCVGAPWNSVAVEAGAGFILHPCCQIVRDCPEKILATRLDGADSDHVDEEIIRSSLRDASDWCADAANHQELADMLAADCGPPVMRGTMERILAGELQIGRGGGPILPDYLCLEPAATLLSGSQGLWLYAQMVIAGQTAYSETGARLAADVFVSGASPRGLERQPQSFAGPFFDAAHVRDFIRRSAPPI